MRRGGFGFGWGSLVLSFAGVRDRRERGGRGPGG